MNNLMSAVMTLASNHLGAIHVRNGQVVSEYCPFCGGGENKDKHTFAVSQYNGAYNCKRGQCGVKGTFKDLCDYFGEVPSVMTISAPLIQRRKTYDLPDQADLLPMTDEIVTYFATRMISEETLKEFNISADKEGNIVFPFYRDGKYVYAKFRKPRKYVKGDGSKEWAVRNTEPILFGMQNVTFSKPLYITEGEIDALSLYEAGIHNVVSVPSGVSNMEWVTLCWDWLEKFSSIVLFGDNDEPGIDLVNTLMRRLGEDRCMIVKDYPNLIVDGVAKERACKDANEILYCYGATALKEIAKSAEPAPIKGIISLSSINHVDPATQPRIYTRIPALDYMIGGLCEGGLTIWTGKRGEGKSTISGQIMLNAIQQGYNVCAYSGELSASRFSDWVHTQAVESKYVGVRSDVATGKNYTLLSPLIRQRINDWLTDKFYLFDNAYISDELQTDAIINAFTMCARRYACKLFVVDNLMSAICASRDNEYKAQTDFIKALKSFAVRYKTHVIIVAHPRKTQLNQELGNDDILGSSNITNLADNVIVSEKPNQRVIKNREFGTTGLIQCGFNPANRRVFEMATGDRTVYGWDHTDITLPEVAAQSLPEFRIQSGIPFRSESY